jgi:hypothetical protein
VLLKFFEKKLFLQHGIELLILVASLLGHSVATAQDANKVIAIQQASIANLTRQIEDLKKNLKEEIATLNQNQPNVKVEKVELFNTASCSTECSLRDEMLCISATKTTSVRRPDGTTAIVYMKIRCNESDPNIDVKTCYCLNVNKL